MIVRSPNLFDRSTFVGRSFFGLRPRYKSSVLTGLQIPIVSDSVYVEVRVVAEKCKPSQVCPDESDVVNLEGGVSLV